MKKEPFIEVEEVDLWGWRGLRLTTDRVQISAAPQAGGRVLSLSLDGVEAFFSLAKLHGRRVNLDQVKDVRAAKRDLGWLHFGGYKTWLAPQNRWTDALPFLDLDSGAYTIEFDEGPSSSIIHLTSLICRETGMQLRRSLLLNHDGSVTVEQAMTNQSDRPAAWGLWDVTQVAGPGKAILPIATNSRFSGGIKAYETEGRSPEVIDQFVERTAGLATVSCSQVESFKYGTDSAAGWLLGLLDRRPDHWLAYLKLIEPQPDGDYPHQAIAEVYDSAALPYFELEVHSPLQHLVPGATYSCKETWILDWLPKTIAPADLGVWVAEARQAHSAGTEA